MIPKAGRVERRFSATVDVHMASLDRPWLLEQAVTENVSPCGARILAKDEWRSGERVVLASPGGSYPYQARVVYCQVLDTGKTAVGLQLATRRLAWMGPSKQVANSARGRILATLRGAAAEKELVAGKSAVAYGLHKQSNSNDPIATGTCEAPLVWVR